jgi:hypothetical protein
MCAGFVEGDRGKTLIEYMNSLGYMAFGHWASEAGSCANESTRLYLGMRQDSKKKVIDWTIETSANVSRERVQEYCEASMLPSSMLP